MVVVTVLRVYALPEGTISVVELPSSEADFAIDVVDPDTTVNESDVCVCVCCGGSAIVVELEAAVISELVVPSVWDVIGWYVIVFSSSPWVVCEETTTCDGVAEVIELSNSLLP